VQRGHGIDTAVERFVAHARRLKPITHTIHTHEARTHFLSGVDHGAGCSQTKLRGLRINPCPFVNLPEKKRTTYSLTKEEMKKCIWLKPELTIGNSSRVQPFKSSRTFPPPTRNSREIEFAEWTPDGHLRHSKFVALRDDKDARTVTREDAQK
jgi:hypothetical protein